MFKFTNLSQTEDLENQFDPNEFRIAAREFLERRRASKASVFDLRSPEAFADSHIPGAHSLSIEYFETSIYQMPFSGDILLYGGSEGEARTAAKILYDNGFDNFNFVDTYEDLFKGVDASMFSITETARAKILERLRDPGQALKGVRMVAESKTPLKATYHLGWVQSEQEVPHDILVQFDQIPVYISLETIPYLPDTVIDYVDGELAVINEKSGIGKLQGSIDERVRQILDNEINPMVAMHGGVVSLLEVKGSTVFLEFGGGCQGCGMVDVTLKQGVEAIFKENIPEVTELLDVTDHANGCNPYYRPSTK